MAVDSHHPLYDSFADIWQMMRHAEAGEESVKEAGETYLPKPSGFTKQSDGGAAMYDAYKKRAQFPDIIVPTLSGMVGVIHRIDAQISGLEEGKPLAYMWEQCTRDDRLPLEAFHRRITTEILLTGRYGVLTDVPSGNDPSVKWADGRPYFVGYTAEQIINWSEYDQDMFVMDESRKVRDPAIDEFSWQDEKRYRVLRLVDGRYQVQVYKDQVAGEIIDPQVTGAKPLTEIPMVIAGPRELSVRTIDQPPMKGVASASFNIYRYDADYHHQLFNSGQETLFLIGETETIPAVVGSGVVIGLPLSADAKYVGPSGVGINAHRVAITDARQEAVAAGVKLFDTGAKAESGEALRLRASAQTATLTTIAQTSAALLERALRFAAQFIGQDPTEIIVKPNLQFIDTKMTPDEAVKLVSVWQSGAISKVTLHENLVRGEIASSERDFEEEEDLINQEIADNPMVQGIGPNGKAGYDTSNQFTGSRGLPQQQLNGGRQPRQIPSRFVESGDGLTIENA